MPGICSIVKVMLQHFSLRTSWVFRAWSTRRKAWAVTGRLVAWVDTLGLGMVGRTDSRLALSWHWPVLIGCWGTGPSQPSPTGLQMSPWFL